MVTRANTYERMDAHEQMSKRVETETLAQREFFQTVQNCATKMREHFFQLSMEQFRLQKAVTVFAGVCEAQVDEHSAHLFNTAGQVVERMQEDFSELSPEFKTVADLCEKQVKEIDLALEVVQRRNAALEEVRHYAGKINSLGEGRQLDRNKTKLEKANETLIELQNVAEQKLMVVFHDTGRDSQLFRKTALRLLESGMSLLQQWGLIAENWENEAHEYAFQPLNDMNQSWNRGFRTQDEDPKRKSFGFRSRRGEQGSNGVTNTNRDSVKHRLSNRDSEFSADIENVPSLRLSSSGRQNCGARLSHERPYLRRSGRAATESDLCSLQSSERLGPAGDRAAEWQSSPKHNRSSPNHTRSRGLVTREDTSLTLDEFCAS